MFNDGTYKVVNIPEKQYVNAKGKKAVFIGVADKASVFSAAYKSPKNHHCFAKRFIVKQFILEKEYRFFEEGMELQFLSTQPEPKVELQFIPKIKQKISKVKFSFAEALVKGASAKGIKMSQRGVKKIKELKE